MYKIERQARIKQILNETNSVDIHFLSAEFKVTPVTIRKDLSEMEANGILLRSHGGAVSVSADVVEPEKEFFVGYNIKYERSKEIIGQIAASFIVGGEWVFLGSGTTAYYIARALVNRPNLNVLTNNLLVAYELTKNRSANLIMTGGSLSHSTFNLGGEIFGAYIRDITISKAFIGIAGIDINRGYTVTTAGEFNVVNLIREISDMTYIVADDSKFNIKEFIRVADLSIPHSLITNKTPSNDYMEFFRQHQISVYSPENRKL